MLDDPDRESQECIELAHPFGIASGKIVVDGDDVNTSSAQSVQVNGGRRYECLAFAGGHFCDAAAMKHDSTNELNIEMHHGPCGGLVADGKCVLSVSKAAGSLLYHGKRFGKDLLKPAGQSARVGDRGKLLFPFGGFGSQSII